MNSAQFVKYYHCYLSTAFCIKLSIMKLKSGKQEVAVLETGGSSIVQQAPLFSHDSRYLICPCGNIIKVFSIATGYCYKRLVGHENEVTSIQHHPKIKLQIISSSKDGTVKFWDYEDGILLSSLKLSSPILFLFSRPHYSDVVFIVTKQEPKNELHKLVLEGHVTDSDGCVKTDLLISSVPANVGGQVCLSDKFIAVSYSRRLAVYKDPQNIKKLKKSNRITLKLSSDASNIKCFACHPFEPMIATGHENGQILFWHNIFDVTPIVSSQHWHSLEVLSISFTPSGSSVLSGGHESVLVQWREEEKNFLPRLGSPISKLAVSEDNSLYACCHTENSITIVTSYFTIKQTIEGFAASYQGLPCGLHYDEKSDSCVTNGKPGHLLFYQPSSDTQLFNLDVISQNFISSADLEKPLSQTKITKVDFCKTSPNRHVMATLEFNKKSQRDQKLKFWNFSEEDQQWALNTIVSSPHAEKRVTSLHLHPHQGLCATTATDGFCKLWCVEDGKWICDSCISYRDSPCLDSSFSEDGSMLALVFGQSVLLCNSNHPDQLKLLMSYNEEIRRVEFGRKSCCHFLVVAAQNCLQVWNILTNSLSWCIDLPGVELLIPDLLSPNMAVITQTNSVHVFIPGEKQPLCSCDLEWKVSAACFVPSRSGQLAWCQNSELYLVSDKMTVHKLASASEKLSYPGEIGIEQAEKRNPMSSILSSTAASVDQSDASHLSVRPKIKQKALSYILNTPSHVLPPMKSLCDQFISTLLLNGTQKVENNDLLEGEKITDECEPMQTEIAVEETEKAQLEELPGQDISSKDFDFLLPYINETFVN